MEAWRCDVARPDGRCTAGTSQTGCWFSNSSSATAPDQSRRARDARCKAVTRRDAAPPSGTGRGSAAQSDVVEVADDDAVGLPQRRLRTALLPPRSRRRREVAPCGGMGVPSRGTDGVRSDS